MSKVSVIIPVYNEQESIDRLIDELNSYFAGAERFATEVLFIDDGSTDKTLFKLKHASHQSYVARIISFSKNFGSHAALRAGIFRARGDYITFMYADLQDPLSLIGDLYDEIIQKEVDVVWAYRNATVVAQKEKLFSGFYAFLMRKYAIPSFPRKGFDIVMFNKKVKACLNENIENNSSVFIQILSFGFRQSSITYNKQARMAGKSKWTLSKKIKLFIDSFVAFSFAPIRLVSLIGIAFFVTGSFWTTYIIFRKVFYNDLSSGWPALVSILMLGFGITNICLGIIAEYLWRTLDVSRKRPVFIVDEVVDDVAEYENEARKIYQL